LADILTETAERGFALAIGILVVPFLFPMPPGFTTIFGSACLLLSVQMAWGRRSPWLPRRVAKAEFPKKMARQILNNIHRVTRLFEKIAQPRWPQVADHPHIWQINGLCIAWLTFLLMTPVPFTNPIPTIGILCFVVATLESDGLLVCVSYGITAAITAFFGVLTYLSWQLIVEAFTRFWQFLQ
jgi:hypothetical protein